MFFTIPRLTTLVASAVVAAGVVTGAAERSPTLLLVSGASVGGIVVGWVVVLHDADSPVGPAVAWSVAAIVAVQSTDYQKLYPGADAHLPGE